MIRKQRSYSEGEQEGLEAAKTKLSGGAGLLTVQAHVAKESDVENLFDKALENFGKIDGLINNVGMNIITSVVDADSFIMAKNHRIESKRHFLMFKKSRTANERAEKGENSEYFIYCCKEIRTGNGNLRYSKSRNRDDDQGSGAELAPFDIQVNAVAPGMVRTKFSEPFWSNDAFTIKS